MNRRRIFEATRAEATARRINEGPAFLDVEIVQNFFPLIRDDSSRAFRNGVGQGIRIEAGGLGCGRQQLFVARRSRIHTQKTRARAVAYLRTDDSLEGFRVSSSELPLLSRYRARNAKGRGNYPPAC